MDRPFQRKGAESNAQAGREFELKVKKFFEVEGIPLTSNKKMRIGVDGREPHEHSFDLVNEEQKIIVECKSHTWTESDKMPSAKLTIWDQAMYIFHVTPKGYRKIFVVQKDYSKKQKETLAQYYIRIKSHLIPTDVEIWEFDKTSEKGYRIEVKG
jgi:hypothetical protein